MDGNVLYYRQTTYKFYDKLFLFLCMLLCVVWRISNNRHLCCSCSLFPLLRSLTIALSLLAAICYILTFSIVDIFEMLAVLFLCHFIFLEALQHLVSALTLFSLFSSVLFRLVFLFEFSLSSSSSLCVCFFPIFPFLICFCRFDGIFFFTLHIVSWCMCILLAFALIVLCSFPSIYLEIARTF